MFVVCVTSDKMKKWRKIFLRIEEWNSLSAELKRSPKRSLFKQVLNYQIHTQSFFFRFLIILNYILTKLFIACI